jgi:hypothetical protein
MKISFASVSGFLAVLAASTLFAQDSAAPAPGAQPTDPSAASSPHQRATTKAPSEESQPAASGTNPSDASTPHQKQSMKKKHKAKKTAPPSDSTATPSP